MVAGSEPLTSVTRLLVVVPVSVLDDASLDRLREAIWGLTGLIRVFPRTRRRVDDEPFALPIGATVADVADLVHHELGAACTGARIWGASARFDGQRVGRAHVLADGDVVEVVTRGRPGSQPWRYDTGVRGGNPAYATAGSVVSCSTLAPCRSAASSTV